MTIIGKQDLINAKKDRKLFVIKNFYKDFPSWEDIDNFYDLAKSSKTINYNSFGTFTIENDLRVYKYYRKAVEDIALYYKGNPAFAMMIVHFINWNNNKMTDNSLANIFSKFTVDNPKKIPEELSVMDDGVYGWPRQSWEPAIHSDAEDRFFIQGSGQSLWKVFHDNKELNYEILLDAGDMAYIPKGVIHSVESMCPRHSVSIAFSDDPEILNA